MGAKYFMIMMQVLSFLEKSLYCGLGVNHVFFLREIMGCWDCVVKSGA